MILNATGNHMDSHDGYHTFLEITGGSGNTPDEEVHLMMRSNVADLLNTIDRADK